MTRTIVMCLDGTNNEPENGMTNVARTYAVAVKDDDQLVYYDPGVGTMGARGAVTPWGRKATRAAGLIAGFGIKDNLEEAYSWLAEHYRRGDRIMVFGFSRGAYTARALTGMLHTVGLIRPGTANLVPYAVKLYAQSGKEQPTKEEKQDYWRTRRSFLDQFGNSDFVHPFDPHRYQVRYAGLWDTVKSVGWLNARARIEQARWPYTDKIAHVEYARHAMSIDEKRRFYPIDRLDADLVAASEGRLQEAWFAGVHSDVGGQYLDDHRLSDIAFTWVLQGAVEVGFRLDPKRYRPLVGSRPWGEPLPADYCTGTIHQVPRRWWWLGGWSPRSIGEGDTAHPSVHDRIDATAGSADAYVPALPPATAPPRA